MRDTLAIHRMLLASEIHHEIVRLPRAIASGDELPDVLGVPAERCLVNRPYTYRPRTGNHFLATVILRAGKVPPLAGVAAAIGARTVRRAPADLVNNITDYAADLVSPLLLPEIVTVVVDQEVVDSLHADDIVYTVTGEPRTALGLRALDLFTLCGAKPADLVQEISSHVEL